jgi:VWFA-related protein
MPVNMYNFVCAPKGGPARRSPVVSALYLACLMLALGAGALSQSASPSSSTFSSNTELVLVPVHVLDGAGRPMRELKQQDFVLKSDGVPQRIALFDEVQTSSTPPPQPAAAKRADAKQPAAPRFSNFYEDGAPEQLLIVAIDMLNTPVMMQGWARDQLIKYLQHNPPRLPVEVVAITPSGLRQVHAFTSDTAALIESIKHVQSHISQRDTRERLFPHLDQGGNIDSYSSLVTAQQERQAFDDLRNVDNGSVTLHSFEQIAWAYSGIPGRKTVLWLTSGFPILQEVPDGAAMIGHTQVAPGGMAGSFNQTGIIPVSAGRHLSNQLLPDLQRAFTTMNRSNVVVYPIDVAGLPLEDMWDISQPPGLYTHPELSHFGPALPDESAADRDGMKELARRTGGNTCTAGNSLSECLDQALTESTDYYLLGFYVPQQQRKDGWHKLKVSVNPGHGEVRARSTYYLHPEGTPLEQEQEDDLRSAINADVEYTGIFFSVELGAKAGKPGAPVTFRVSVPAASVLVMPGQEKLSFDVIAIPLSDKGEPLDAKSRIVKLDMPLEVTQKVLSTGWNLIDTVDDLPSITAVKVIIRDNATGRVGSVVFPLGSRTAGS